MKAVSIPLSPVGSKPDKKPKRAPWQAAVYTPGLQD